MSLRVEVDSGETESSKGSMTRSHRKEGVPKFSERRGNREVEYVNNDFWPKVVKVMNRRIIKQYTTTTTPNPFSRKSSEPFRSNFAPPKDTSTSKTRKRNPEGHKKSNVGNNHTLEEQRILQEQRAMRKAERITRDKDERKRLGKERKRRGGNKLKTRRRRSI